MHDKALLCINMHIRTIKNNINNIYPKILYYSDEITQLLIS